MNIDIMKINQMVYIKMIILMIFTALVSSCSFVKEETDKGETHKENTHRIHEVGEVEKAIEEIDIFDAVMKGNNYIMTKFLESENKDINSYDSQGYTPLMYLVRLNNAVMAEKFIHHGAQIYQPHKINKHQTAFSMVDRSNEDMIRLFESESLRYAKVVEDLVENGSYGKALNVSRDNHFPTILTLPRSQKTALEWMSHVYSHQGMAKEDEDSIEYVRYLLEGASQNPQYLLESERHFQKLSKAIDHTPLLQDMEEVYLNGGVALKQISILEKDISDMNWLLLKVKVTKKYGTLKLDHSHIHLYVDAIKFAIKWQGVKSKKSRILIKEILKSKGDDEDKVKFLDKLFSLFFSLEKGDYKYLQEAQVLLKTWKAYQLPPSKGPFDLAMLQVLQSLKINEKVDYRTNIVGSLVDLLVSFYPDNSNRSKKSIEYIIDSNFIQEQKARLLNLLALKTKEMLPPHIFSYAIRKGGQSSLDLIIDSNISFSPEEQQESILTAISASTSALAAHKLIASLNNQGIRTDTPYGVKALKIAFKKVWENEEFQEPLLSLLLSNPSPINSMSEIEVLEILSGHLAFIKKTHRGLSIMEHTLKKLQRDLPIYHNNIPSPIQSGLKSMRISFVWDYILTMHDIYKEITRASTHLGDSIEWLHDLNLIHDTIGLLISKFPQEEFSMVFFEEHPPFTFKSQNRGLLDNMLALSLILSANKDSLYSALSSEDARDYEIHIEGSPLKLSWKAFVSGDFYRSYADNKKFWGSVSKSLLDSGRHFALKHDRSSVEFIKILISDNQLIQYPQLSHIIKNQKIILPVDQESCALDKSKVDEVNLPDIKHSGPHPNPSVGYSLATVEGFSPRWANLGTMEALRPLKERSCLGEKLSQEETHFIRNFVLLEKETLLYQRPDIPHTRKYGKDPRLADISGQHAVDCDSSSMVEGSQVAYYSQIGKRLSHLEMMGATEERVQSFIPPYGKCYKYLPSKWMRSSVMRSFLSYWYKCAEDAKNGSLVSVFKEIQEEINIAPQKEPMDAGVYTCRWKSL